MDWHVSNVDLCEANVDLARAGLLHGVGEVVFDGSLGELDSVRDLSAPIHGFEDTNRITPVDVADFAEDMSSPQHSKYQEGGEWAYANEVTGRTFFITQYETHKPSGRVLLDQATVEKFCASAKRSAWVRHDKDRLLQTESKELGLPLGTYKAPHFHIVAEFANAKSIGAVARQLGIAPQYVEKKGERGKQVFWDCLLYTSPSPRDS